MNDAAFASDSSRRTGLRQPSLPAGPWFGRVCRVSLSGITLAAYPPVDRFLTDDMQRLSARTAVAIGQFPQSLN
jgi:hypothetical protein